MPIEKVSKTLPRKPFLKTHKWLYVNYNIRTCTVELEYRNILNNTLKCLPLAALAFEISASSACHSLAWATSGFSSTC
jgi:hypothetical protein